MKKQLLLKLNIVPKLGIKPAVSSRNNDLETGNLSAIIKKYRNHSSIIAIEKYMKGLRKKSAKLQMIYS